MRKSSSLRDNTSSLYYIFSLKEHINIPYLLSLPNSPMYFKTDSILYNNIFTDYLISTEIDVNLNKLVEEAYVIEDNEIGIDKTNVGGYHSPLFEEANFSEFNRLREGIITFSNHHLFNDLDVKYTVDRCSWWVNISGFKDSMDPHIHGDADLIGVFYIKVPEDSGYLKLLNNGGAAYTKLGRPNSVFKCDTLPGRFYLMPGHMWHLVTTNYSHEPRITAAYNLYIN